MKRSTAMSTAGLEALPVGQQGVAIGAARIAGQQARPDQLFGDQESALHLGDTEILAGAQRHDMGDEHPHRPLIVLLNECLIGPEACRTVGTQFIQGKTRVGRGAETVEHTGPGFDDDLACLFQQVIETGFRQHTYPCSWVVLPKRENLRYNGRMLHDIKPVGRPREFDLLLMAGCGVVLRGSPRPCVPRDGGGTKGGDAKWQSACKTS